ncbi:uncharacterized protein LOC133488626 [Phyllopteryx taeniolatus]|uniref:uncharacterized protein LOC133488626 n=1 Tax=Phyllopteryx taeniolatus TaxID=161469 RepID=UPI002AD59458|nr:uncharacterized protein LOC133488626 [Phyllopteryx taeniolatus]
MKKPTGVPVWVIHTPTPETSKGDDDSTSNRSSAPPYVQKDNNDTKGSFNKMKSLIPNSWGSMTHYWKRRRESVADSETSSGKIQILPNGTRVSPPVSPFPERMKWDETEEKPFLKETSQSPNEDSLLTSIHPVEYYAEKLEVYNQKYSYLKSWPGLLRLLAGIELLFGAMVVACVIGYIHKDSEWSNSYGLYNGVYNNGLGLTGYSYGGPMTPFVVSVAGVCWLLTMIVLVLGMTMYYRTILLDAPWWPLTEALINVTLFLLYMATAIVYLNDLNRGGLCYMTVGISPILGGLCRVEGGQMAGTAFIFINMTMYLGSFLVCLKMWRHEAGRRERVDFEDKAMYPGESPRSNLLAPPKPKHISFKTEADNRGNTGPNNQHGLTSDIQRSPVCQKKNEAAACIPKVQIIADYVLKYPEISCVEEREKYKAVFNDQYQEYKELYKDINTTLNKFSELDAVIARLTTDGKSREDRDRIKNILKQYEQKKSDPAFLEKKQRCDYLKAKLSHVKNRIRVFDQDTSKFNKTMYEPRHYDSCPLYSPPYSATSHSLNPERSRHSPYSNYVSYTSKPLAESQYVEETPQHFYRWFSPPGFVKTFQGATVLMCFLIFACVASTLVWDINGFGYSVVGGAGSVPGAGQGYYGGSYGYSSSYMTPQSAKAAMISMAAINFLVSLGFLVGSFSRSRAIRGSSFYLTVFICDTILAVLQGIIDIIFVIGVNPMSQSSQSMMYNPVLMMCQNIPDRPSLSGSIGAGFPGGFPMYNQYLYHYCFMDPEEAVALALSLMVVLALSLAAYYSWKTRSKIWRHGKANIYWDEPLVRHSEGQNVQDWVNHVGEGRSTQRAPTFVISEKGASDLREGNSVAYYCHDTGLSHSQENLKSKSFCKESSKHQDADLLYQNSRPALCSSSSGEADSSRKSGLREQRNHGDRAARETVERRNETPYNTGGDTADELDQNRDRYLFRQYPEIISDQQRQQYRRDFDSALVRYKSLCEEMDDICDQIHKLSRELHSLDKDSMKYQDVVDEYNRLKDLKRGPDYQGKKRESKELRQKLFHIKRLVKNFDQGLC